MINNVLEINGESCDGFVKIQKPKCIIINAFDDAALKTFRDEFQMAKEKNNGIIPIYIDSPGGYVTSLLGMVDIINSYDGIVMTIGNGRCYSAGAVLLTCGTPGYRYASENTQIMIHEVAAGTWGKVTEMLNDVEHSGRVNKILFKILDKNCDKKKGYFLKKIAKMKNNDWFMSAKEAKELNVIDHKGLPTLDFTAKGKIKIS